MLLEARKNLSAKETYCRRQSAISSKQMKTIQSTLQKFYTREERIQLAAEKRILRSQLDRKELEDEVERIEIEFEHRLVELAESHKQELEDLSTKLSEEVEAVRAQCNSAMTEQVLHQTESYNESIHHFEHALALLESQAIKAAVLNSSLQEELSSLKEQNVVLSHEVNSSKSVIDNLQSELESRRAICEALSDELATIKDCSSKEYAQLESSAGTIQKAQAAEIEQLKAANNKYAVQLKRNAAELSRRISQYATMQARLDDTMHKLSYLEQQGLEQEQEFGAEVETKHHIFRSLKEENRSLEESLSLASDEIKRLRDEEYLHTCVISDMTREIQSLVVQRKELQTSVSELQHTLQSLQNEVDAKTAAICEEERMNQKLRKDLEEMKTQIKSKVEDLMQRETALATIKSHFEIFEASRSEMERIRQQLELEVSSSKGQIAELMKQAEDSSRINLALQEERNTLKSLQQESLQHTDSLFEALTAEEELSGRLQRELEQHRHELSTLSVEVESLRNKLSTFHSKCEEVSLLQSNVDEKEKVISSLEMELVKVEGRYQKEIEDITETHDRELQAMIEERNELSKRFEDLSISSSLQLKQMNTLNMAAADEISSVLAQKDILHAELQRVRDELTANNSAYSEQLSTLEQENENLLDQLHALRGDYAELTSRNDCLSKNALSLETRLEGMFEEFATMQQRHSDDSGRLLSVVLSKDADIGRLNVALNESSVAHESLLSELQHIQRLFNQSKEENESLLHAIDALRAAKQEMQATIDRHAEERLELKNCVSSHLLQVLILFQSF